MYKPVADVAAVMFTTLGAGSAAVPLQSAASPVTVAGTLAGFAVFLSVTAHLAARSVFGDVRVRNAFGVGPVPAAISFVTAALTWPAFVGITLAVVADGVAFRLLYGRDARLTAYVTFIHVVVSIILGVVLYGVWSLALTAPT